MKHIAPLLAAIAIAIPSLAKAQARLLPVDQAATVPDFFSFRAQLQVAVAKRDLKVILAAMSKDVKLSFGGDDGVSEFGNVWKPESPDTKLWEVLAGVLALGGTFDAQGAFTAPYVFTRWPQDKDSFSHMAAIGTGVRVRTAPNAAASAIASLDFSLVEVSEDAPSDEMWVQVKVGPGRVGYVDRRYLRSPIDYRIRFVKQEGKWQAVFFLAGD